MIDFYTAPTSNGFRAAIALEECGVTYRVHKFDVMKGESRNNPDYMKINPLGSIPAIVDSDGPGGKPFILTQSWAILLYYAEKTGKFLPKSLEQRALAYQWLTHGAVEVAGGSTALFQVAVRSPEKNAAIEAHLENLLLGYMRNADLHLGQTAYLAGDEVTVADLGFYPAFNSRRPLAAKAGDLKNLNRWADAIAARPGVQRGMKVGL